MLFDEFLEQFSRLRNAYGERIYNPERQKTLWEFFRLESKDKFKTAIDFVISEKNNAPAASDIRAALGSTKYQELRRWTPDWDCSWCGQTGLVSAKLNNTHYCNLFICPCEFGKYYSQPELLPWDTSAFLEYTLDPWAQGVEAGIAPHKIPHKNIKVGQNVILAVTSKIGSELPNEHSLPAVY